MITRQEFPYLQELVINDAYAVKNLRVPVFQPGQEFKHLVLTGRNGSGKTTVIKSIASKIQFDVSSSSKHIHQIRNLRHWIESTTSLERVRDYSQQLKEFEATATFFRKADLILEDGLFPFSKNTLIAYFPAQRGTNVLPVTSPSVEDIYVAAVEKPSGDADFSRYFKQYLVNKKVSQALAYIEGKREKADEQNIFFQRLEHTLKQVFSNDLLTIEFISEQYEFLLDMGNGQKINLNQLSAGFSAFLNILTDLLMRTDLLRKQANDYSYDPCGFVLIDEPETHLHLEMQYQILPLLTSLFPNLQFIVATHSPAVASSIKNATVFDLSTGQALGDSAAGSSFSELMQTHFGLENEYSNVADQILSEVAEISEMPDRAAARARLQKLLDEQGRYMSPVLRLDVQAQLLHLQREQAA
jgi:predicted ATP-binding protein involved in virulence